ncbi:signal peptidase I [Sediminivirga luteola]|uniref:signal peptidase I n=1 Tax=Sediminivirga luteola TaxID=1774748 RepID=UPI001F55CF81|nr:signal peptidase I [Sediminivirga luteola]MCI2266835.1 signal peptidase I [Sediminivirga luteola]
MIRSKRRRSPGASRTPWGRRAADVVLSIAALAGTVCIVLVPLAWIFDISIIMFRTGSMVPTLQPGDIAVVREVPADEAAVGDIVTVDREGQLPVTHRVTGIEPAEAPDTHRITMRGDANDTDDPHPYEVQTVRAFMFSVPGIASGVAFLSDTRVLAVATLVMSVVVGWAFWPRGPVAEEEDEPRRHDDLQEDKPQEDDAGGDDSGRDEASRNHRLR